LSIEWKKEFIKKYKESGLPFHLIDPSRGGFVDGRHDDIIVQNNKKDIANSIALVAYTRTPSAGTSMEIMFAYMLHIPVYTFCPSTKISAWVLMHSYATTATVEGLIQYLRRLTV